MGTNGQLRKMAGRMIFAHIVLWGIYVTSVVVVTRLYNGGALSTWPVPGQAAIALVPVLPVFIWLVVAARVLRRFPDELTIKVVTEATATAGAIVLTLLFAQGWLDLLIGQDYRQATIFQGFDITPWAHVAIFGLVWTVDIQRRTRKYQN